VAVRWRAGAAVGVASAAAAIGIGELVAVSTGARSAPLVAVGGVVVDTVPEPVKAFAISLFGTYDKVALQVGTVVLLAVFAALVGVAATKDIRFGYGGIALFAAVGVAAAATRPGASVFAVVPSLVGGAAAIALMWWLLRPAEPFDAEPVDAEPVESAGRIAEPAGSGTDGSAEAAAGPSADQSAERPVPVGVRKIDRRVVLGALGFAAVAGYGGRTLAGVRGVAEARSEVALPLPISVGPAVPSAADLRLPTLAPYVTSNRVFYRIDTALVVPQVDPSTWRLRIFGRVRKEIELTFEQLLARPMIERHVTLCCVSNEVGGDLIGNARWLGVPVKDLLDEAGPLDGADQVVSRSADGWTCGTPTAILRDGRDAMLAVGMNSEPLPVDHGFPVRMVTPGLYGYVSACKWLVSMELTSFNDFDAYWVRRGWAAQGPIKTQSRIDVPRRGTEVSAGRVTVAGVAWAQHTGVDKVEVRVDGGEWQPATLAETVSVDTWRQWSWGWDAPAGRHTISVRATDRTGAVQDESPRPPFPDGATGWDTIEVSVR